MNAMVIAITLSGLGRLIEPDACMSLASQYDVVLDLHTM